MVKHLPAMWETWVQSLGQEDPLEKKMATHFSTLAWRIPVDKEAWRATVHGVAKSRIQLGDWTTTEYWVTSFLPPTVRMVMKSESERHSVMSDSLQPHALLPARFLSPWNFPGKNTGLGTCFLLQGIFPTQGSNLSLPHCRQILYHLRHQGSP